MFFLKPIRFLFKALAAQDSPNQLAWGFALGVLLGLVPKSNLLAQIMVLAVCSTRVNLGAAFLSGIIFSFVAYITDPLAHYIGCVFLVKAGFLRPVWTAIYNMPLVPWTSFNNTLVLGNFVLGLALLWPAYKLSRPLFEKYRENVGKKIRKWKLVKFLLGAQIAEGLGTE